MERRLKAELPLGHFENVSVKRSQTMAAIRGKHNKTTEITLRMALVRAGVKGWKTHDRDLPGTPDVYFPRLKFAIFIDGCFWHACPKCGHIPQTNNAFWFAKLSRNRERDKLATKRIKAQGISVTRIWEHSLKTPHGLASAIDRILKKLNSKARTQANQKMDALHG